MMAKVCLIACVQSKLNYKAPASELYTSPLFQKASAHASRNFDRWYILSAKHGLLEPDEIIAPYNMALNNMYRDKRKKWSLIVFEKLKNKLSPGDEITILAGYYYRQDIVPLLKESGYRVKVPMEGLSIGWQLRWLNKRLGANKKNIPLERFYKLLFKLERGVGGKRLLGQCTGRMDWPERGLYFIFEPGEFRSSHSEAPRVVRVGTHAVSKGSKSTLWNRLIAHRGTQAGGGNHRGSIFRLHVGAALKAKNPRKFNFDSWSEGQSAPKKVRIIEEPLERAVSDHIRSMPILWLKIDDNPGPRSDRVFIERNSIGLLSRAEKSLDSPSTNWLGNWSPKEEIHKSGLWNLNHIGYKYDRNFLDTLEQYVEITLGKKKAVKRSIAPCDWYKQDS